MHVHHLRFNLKLDYFEEEKGDEDAGKIEEKGEEGNEGSLTYDSR